MMASQPIDLRCPIKAVSYLTFERYFNSLSNGDRYLHPHYLNRKMVALWHWDIGVWWMCPALNVLGDIVITAMRNKGIDLSAL